MNKWLPQLALTFWRRTAPLRSPVGLAILAGSFVGLRLLWIHMQRPANLEANAAAYGSIRDFYGAAQFNHDGSQFIFVATANDRGRAVFLCDSATGKKRQIIEDTHGVGIWNDDFDVQAVEVIDGFPEEEGGAAKGIDAEFEVGVFDGLHVDG